MESVIEISNLSKQYFINQEYDNLFKRLFNRKKNEIKALSDINLTVNKGSMLALLGKNGAGKTTLVKTLSGIVTPSSGKVSVLGFDPLKNRYKYSYHIGVVLGQKSLLWYNIPVVESLKLYKSIYEISDTDFNSRLKMFDEMLNIKELLYIPVRKLSLGQRMKCELVASLLHNPEILFLDEPTIGLDLISKQQIYKFLKSVNDEMKTTVILTTHNIDDVEKLCDRVVMIDKRKKIYDGEKEKLLQLDNKKTIVVTGNAHIPKELNSYLVEQDGDRLTFQCSSDEMHIISKIMSGLSDGGDIEIKGSDLEYVVSQIYEGEIVL